MSGVEPRKRGFPPSRQWFIFADESGNFDFRAHQSASRYFSIGSISLTSDSERVKLRAQLDGLSDRLLLSGFPGNGAFHASEDRQAVRDRVFPLLMEVDFQVHITAIEKRKVAPERRESDAAFYGYAWHLHIVNLLTRVAPGDQLFVIAAALQTKQSRRHFLQGVQHAVEQSQPRGVTTRVYFWRDESDRCLQAADYCLWAASRLLEQGDSRAKAQLGGRLDGTTIFKPLAGSQRIYY